MRRYLLLLLLLLTGFISRADTLDYMVIRHNGRPVPANAFTPVTYSLDLAHIDTGDSISVAYYKDAPCFNCVSIIYLIPHNREAIKERAIIYGVAAGTGRNTVLPLNILRAYGDTITHRDFDLYYYEEGLQAHNKPKLVLKIRLQ